MKKIYVILLVFSLKTILSNACPVSNNNTKGEIVKSNNSVSGWVYTPMTGIDSFSNAYNPNMFTNCITFSDPVSYSNDPWFNKAKLNIPSKVHYMGIPVKKDNQFFAARSYLTTKIISVTILLIIYITIASIIPSLLSRYPADPIQETTEI